MGAIRGAARAVGGAAAVAVLAGCGTPPAPAPAPGPTRTAPSAAGAACPEGGVRVLEGRGDSAMGMRIARFRLVNCGHAPYELEGYPQIRLLDRTRAPVEGEVKYGSADIIASQVPRTDAPPPRVTLRPGQEASFRMLWPDPVTDSGAPAVEGRAVEVVPRPGAPRVTVELTAPVGLGNPGRLVVSTWKAATQ
ncbi:DUF4232 domain-containing protein [Streptomyces sp. NPDC127106]|uniref:DUF4232 domain-containing protein n=1 Tax=Streptomyces sp. NPDC127106 TaxID=3345360 RepID=UPI00363FD874